MSRAGKYWTAAIVVVVLGAAIEGILNKHIQPMDSSAPGNSAIVQPPTRELGSSPGLKEKPTSMPPSSAARSSDPVSGQTLMNLATIEGRHTHQGSGTDRSVVGAPFSVSASVATLCVREKIVCPLVYKKLAEFAEEPRDNAWAVEEETNIQDQIESLGPDKYSIRDLECRSTICAVEVASTSGPYLGMAYYYMVKYGLSQDLSTNGYETDALGATVHVVLITFTRHQHMCWDKPCDLSSMTPPP